MLNAAEFSYAVANAHPLLRARAHYIAPANDDYGVVTALSHLLGSAGNE
jgi:hydroxymethylpyrimidine pyrophosphatase-like HAD family hydrolase